MWVDDGAILRDEHQNADPQLKGWDGRKQQAEMSIKWQCLSDSRTRKKTVFHRGVIQLMYLCTREGSSSPKSQIWL